MDATSVSGDGEREEVRGERGGREGEVRHA